MLCDTPYCGVTNSPECTIKTSLPDVRAHQSLNQTYVMVFEQCSAILLKAVPFTIIEGDVSWNLIRIVGGEGLD